MIKADFSRYRSSLSICDYQRELINSVIIAADKAYALCYFLRGGAIGLYRKMQSDFQNIWLFVGLSLLHDVSNVLSKATLNLRIKI